MADYYWNAVDRGDGAAPEHVLTGKDGPDLTLWLGSARPGLYNWRPVDGRSFWRLLAPHALAAVGRRDESAFAPSNLVEVARVRDRVEATYVPAGWNGLRVRAAWSPVSVGDHAGADLEIQVQASTADVVPLLEVWVRSEWGTYWKSGTSDDLVHTAWIEPRDVTAAVSSYDGRETAEALERLYTLPVPGLRRGLRPLRFHAFDLASRYFYVEMVAEDGCARRAKCRMSWGEKKGWPASFVRYGLFGHDLEKGVVLRTRLRGLWLPLRRPFNEGAIRSAYETFQSEPLPLGP